MTMIYDKNTKSFLLALFFFQRRLFPSMYVHNRKKRRKFLKYLACKTSGSLAHTRQRRLDIQESLEYKQCHASQLRKPGGQNCKVHFKALCIIIAVATCLPLTSYPILPNPSQSSFYFYVRHVKGILLDWDFFNRRKIIGLFDM